MFFFLFSSESSPETGVLDVDEPLVLPLGSVTLSAHSESWGVGFSSFDYVHFDPPLLTIQHCAKVLVNVFFLLY